MEFLKKLFGGTAKLESSKSQATPSAAAAGAPVTETRQSQEWRRFFAIAPLHNTAHGLTSLVGPWPPGVSPERFTPTNWSDTIRKVKSFREGMYPCKAFSDVKPEYVVLDDGRIGRKSNRYSDLLICGVLPSHHRAAAEPHVLVWRLIEHYSQWPLAQFVFLLPEFERVSQAAASDRTPYIVAEHVKIHVYTGVENALFAAYEALPEGGLLSDASIERELRTLIS